MRKMVGVACEPLALENYGPEAGAEMLLEGTVSSMLIRRTIWPSPWADNGGGSQPVRSEDQFQSEAKAEVVGQCSSQYLNPLDESFIEPIILNTNLQAIEESMAHTFPKVHIHTSSPNAFFVNSFIIEGPKSLVLVDMQFVLSEAAAVASRIATLKKPLAAILITHPHPDHYNGLASILEKYAATKVVATAGTISGIRETAEPKRAYWTPIVGTDYPQKFAIPDVTVRDRERLSIDGIELVINDFGPAECSDNTAIELPQIDSVIISDLVYNCVHPWLAEGRSDRWLEALAEAKRRFGSATVLYAGYGAAGPPSIMDEQVAYIAGVRERVAQAMKEDPELSETIKTAIRQSITAAHKNWPLEMIIDMNTVSLAGEIEVSKATPAAP